MTPLAPLKGMMRSILLLLLVVSSPTRGSLSVNIDDVGGTTTVNVSGHMDGNALYFARVGFVNSPGGDAGMLPSQGILQAGPQNGAGNQGDFYRIIGPSNFGSAVVTYYSGYRGREQTIAIRGTEGDCFLTTRRRFLPPLRSRMYTPGNRLPP